jgi:hypothetical protein
MPERSTNDHVLYRFRRSYLGPANMLDLSGFYSLDFMGSYFPWRGLIVSGALIAVLFVVGTPTTTEASLFVLVLALAVPPAIELLNRQDFLTREAIIRQFGLVGGRRRYLFLVAIDSVEVSYPRFGSYFSVGDVILRQGATVERLVGIKHPEEAARFILEVKGSNSPHPHAPSPDASA